MPAQYSPMILSKYFVFIHIPKTGGSFVREVCRQAPADWSVVMLDNHPTRRDIPASHQHLPVFGLVRNPFDWYVSWYHYLRQHKNDPFFNKISQNGTLEFKATILAATQVDIGRMFGFPCQFSGSAYGCYINYMFGNDLETIAIGKMESLRSDLLRILRSTTALTPELEQQIRQLPVINRSKHAPYREYYDEELRKHVLTIDRPVLERFGYQY